MNNQVKLGISIYSFAKEFYTRKYSVEDCIGHVASLGLEGFEVVGSQMVRGYPWPSEAFIDAFKETCARNNVKLICYSANMDRGMRADRDLNDDEKFEYTLNDIVYAHKFGAKVMRAQYLVSPEVMERIAPYAEKYDIKVGIEMHSPEAPNTPKMLEYLETFRKTGSSHIGFVPDFGAFADRPNKHFVNAQLARGAHPEIVDYLTKARYEDVPRAVAAETVQKMGANDADKTVLNGFYSFTAFKKPDFEGLKQIMPYCVHFHGKVYALDENDDDICIPVDKLLPIIRDAGFDGYIMSEYEGTDRHVDTYDLLRRHIGMERRILDQA